MYSKLLKEYLNNKAKIVVTGIKNKKLKENSKILINFSTKYGTFLFFHKITMLVIIRKIIVTIPATEITKNTAKMPSWANKESRQG